MDALGAVALRPVSRERLGTLAVQEPALTGRLWRLAMIDAAIVMIENGAFDWPS